MKNLNNEIEKLIQNMMNSRVKAEEYAKFIDTISDLEGKEELDDNSIALRGLIATCMNIVRRNMGKSLEDIAAEIIRNMKILEAIQKDEDGGAKEDEKSEEDHIDHITVRINMDRDSGSGSR